MRRFQFKLGKILVFHQHLEEQAKIRYAQVLQEKVKIEQDKEFCLAQIVYTEKRNVSCMEKGGETDYSLFQRNDRYIEALHKRIIQDEEEIRQLEPQLRKKEEELKRAMQKRKILEKLREKAYLRFQVEAEQEEVDLLDEAASNMRDFYREFEE